MDALAHGLWTNVAFGARSGRERAWAVLFGVLPDAPFLPVLLDRLWRGQAILRGPLPPEGFLLAYRLTHSLIVFGCVVVVVMVWQRQVPWLLFGWLLHIVIDMATHSQEYVATQFLYPFSEVAFDGVAWATPSMIALNYAVLVTVYAVWVLRARGRQRTAL